MDIQKTFKKVNTLDVNNNQVGQVNNSFQGQIQENFNMFRSQQPQKDKLAISGFIMPKQDEVIDQRTSFNDLGFDNRKDKQEIEENEEDMILMNEKYQNRTIQVQYGSLITISLAEYTDCYIYSDGFSSKTIKLKEFKSACGQRDLDFFNSVFMILPTMEYKYQYQLLHQFVFPESKKKQGNDKLQERKQKIQTFQQNIEGEFSANILSFNKLKGTPVSFSTSSFHLVHKASLKYLSVDDTNQDNYIFKFVDFPDQNCLFKFMPCLMFQNQRQTTSNAVFNKDNLYIVSSKPIHNRKPYIFTDYAGQKEINKINALQDESSYGKIYANLETTCKWRINIFQQPELADKSYYMNVGDSIWLNLSEYHYQFSTSRTVNIYQRIKNIIYSNNDQQQSNNLQSCASETNINKNKSMLNNSQPFANQQNQYANQPLSNQNQQIIFSPAATNNLNINSANDKQYQKSSSAVGKIQKQFTLGQEFLTPNYQKTNTLQVEDQNAAYSISGSRVSRQQSGLSNSHEFDDEENYDENLDSNIEILENEIFHNAEVALINQNQDELNNFDKKEEGQKFRSIPSQYKNERAQAKQIEENDSDDEEIKTDQKNQKSQNLNTQGLWKIESEYFAVGGFLEWKQNYRLRHFATGKYLSLQQKNREVEMVLTSRPTPQTLFNFVPVQSISSNQNTFSKQKYISKDSFYCLKSKAVEGYIGINQLKLLEENKCQMKINQTQNQFNIFKMKKANFDDNWEINFLLCCVPILTESIKFINRIGKKSVLERFSKNRSTYEYMFSRIKQVLKDIDAFICNTLTSNISVTEEYGKPSIERSNILREQHVIGILCLLLFKTYPREDLQKALNIENITERLRQEQEKGFNRNNSQFTVNLYQASEYGTNKKPLSKMMEDVILKKYSISILIYKIFQNVCFDNKQNQEYLFNFMSEFQKQVGSQDVVCESLIKFFKLNKMIIQRFSLPIYQRKTQRKLSRMAPPQSSPAPSDIKQAGSHLSAGEEKISHLNMIINKLISYQGQKKNDILKFLTQFCKYMDKAIFNNQEVIFSNLIIKYKNNSQSPLFQLSLQGGDYLTIQLFDNQFDEKQIQIADFLQLDENEDDNEQDGIADEEEKPESKKKLSGQSIKVYVEKENVNNNFLMNQLNLFSNLCLNRNYNCCNYFMEIFPLKTLIEHVENELIKNEQVKAAFLKLVHYIYLDKEPRTIQIKPNHIRIIDQEADQLFMEKLQSERKRVASLSYKESTQNNHQNGNIEMQNFQILPQASKLNKLNQNNQEAVSLLQKVEGQELLTTMNEQDQNEINSLKKLKSDLLKFLLQKEELLKKVTHGTQDKIFNAMTYEAIKMLKMMLKFGIFNQELEAPVEDFKKKTIFIPSKLVEALKKKEEPKPKTEIEKLIGICVKILEYDQFYQETLQDLNIVRRTDEVKKPTDMINLKVFQGGMNLIGQGLTGIKDIFDLATGGGNKEGKKNEQKKKNVALDDISADIVTDPLFKKIQGLKKVLNKYTNKTYLSKEELKKDQEEDYETGIKIQICQIFQELLNIQQDFYLDNTISFFKKNLSQIHNKSNQSKSQQKINVLSLLPEDPFEVGQPYENQEEFINYTEKIPPKSFDAILERSFMETLLISFYFADNPNLSNEIMNLLKRVCNQKGELINNIAKIELLLTYESKKTYNILSLQVSKLKNLIQNSQIWLQISQNKESEIKMTQCLESLQQIINQLTFSDIQNFEEQQQQMKIGQSIFKHVTGDDTILQLIERATILFHSQKEIFFNKQQEKNKKISQIIQMINFCYQILVLFCRNNSAHQELFFEKIFKTLIQFQDFNFGQLPLIQEIIQGNVNICSQLRGEDLEFIAEFIVNHGKYTQFLSIFDIIIQTVTDKDDKQSKIMQCMVIKILFDDRISQEINPFIENFSEQDENTYQFFAEQPDIKGYKEILIRLISKGLDKDSDISLISKMNKVISAENLLNELYQSQTESIQYERSQEKQHLMIPSYKKQKKILKILLYYLTKSQKDYIEKQFRGSKVLLQLIQLITDRLKEERPYTLKFQIILIDRIIPLINIYSELFLREQNIQLTESQDFLALSKTSFQAFAVEYIRQADQFHREYEPIFIKDVRFRHLLRLSNFYSVPIPKTMNFIRDQGDGMIQNQDSEMGQFVARLENSRLDSYSSLNSRKQNSFQMQNTKRGGSLTSRSKQVDQDDISFEGDKLKKKQSNFNTNNSVIKQKTRGDKGSPLLHQQNSPSQQQNGKNIDIQMINFNSIQKNNIAEEDMHGIDKINSNRLSNNKLLTVNLNKHLSALKPADQILFNLQIKDYWESLIELLQNNEEIQEQLQEEKSLLSNNILNVQNIFMADLKDHQKDILLNSEDLITKFLNYIEFWEKNHSDKNDIIFTIKSLSNILKLEDEDDEEQQKIQFDRQIMLDKLNATKICLLLISSDQMTVDNDLLYYIIKFLILILDGGNQTVQRTVYEFFYSSLYSEFSEKFFFKIYNILNDQIMQESTGQKYIIGKKSDKIILRILRLFQLFCEGHNNNLQNLMRDQKSNKKSYNFIIQIIKLLSTYKIHNENYETVIQCFDTLTEFIQGPCHGNQQCIISSKFLDYAVLILSGDKKILDTQELRQQKFLEQNEKQNNASQNFKKPTMADSKGDKYSKNQTLKEKSVKKVDLENNISGFLNTDINEEPQDDFPLHLGKLARLKNKCLITIVSLLECNINSKEFVTKIVRSIPLNILTNNLSRIYSLYQKYEKDYVQSIFNRADEDIDPKKPEEYSELIIENGFNLYILVNLFLENKKGLDEEDDEIKEFFDEFSKEEEEGGLKGLLKNNFLMDLTKVGQAFIGLGVGALKDMYKKATTLGDKRMLEEQQKQLVEIENKETKKNAIKFFKEQVGRIEIVRDQQLQFIYFPILPFCKMLPEEINEDFREQVPRTSVKTQLSALMDKSDFMIKIMKHEERLRLLFQNNKALGFLASHVRLWEKIAFFFACAINIIILFSYSSFFATDEQKADPNAFKTERLFDPRLFYIKSQTNTENYIISLGIVTIIFYSIVVAVFLMKKAPILIGDIWEQYYQLYTTKPKKEKKKKDKGAIPLKLVGALSSHIFGLINKIMLFVLNAVKSVIIMLYDYEIVYYTFNTAVVIFGLTIHPFLFAGCLTDLLRTKVLKNVVAAVWIPKGEIFLLLILFVIFQYYFTLIAYIYFNDHFKDNRCETLWRCFITVFDWTFKQNGGVGTSMWEPNSLLNYAENASPPTTTNLSSTNYNGALEQYTEVYFSRFVYDTLTNIVLLFILINILKGIIVDKFKSLKDDMSSREEDEQFYCFVCGIHREILDKAQEKKGYMYHIKYEHYMWNYIYYRAYLESKDNTEYNGDESYVINKIQESDLGWFPVSKTWSVQRKEDEELRQIHSQVIENIKEINDKLKDTQMKFDSKIEQVITLQPDDDDQYEYID
ncbi:hypothetical protein ABPG72_012532 [Tetrahymena utriculariae]